MKQRLKWEELYEGRFVVTHPRDVGLFKIEKPASIDNEITKELNRDSNLNKLGI